MEEETENEKKQKIIIQKKQKIKQDKQKIEFKDFKILKMIGR